MSDNHCHYRSIRLALVQMFADKKGGEAKKLNVLASLISSIVGSKSTNYPKIASKVPDQTKAESRVKRYSRYINEADPQQEIYLMPFAVELLAKLSNFTLVLIMDGSDVGRNCLTLMLSVHYRGRALSIGWLVTAAQELVPAEADVVFLGDGGFDGTKLQEKLIEFGWKYVYRTAPALLCNSSRITRRKTSSNGSCRC